MPSDVAAVGAPVARTVERRPRPRRRPTGGTTAPRPAAPAPRRARRRRRAGEVARRGWRPPSRRGRRRWRRVAPAAQARPEPGRVGVRRRCRARSAWPPITPTRPPAGDPVGQGLVDRRGRAGPGPATRPRSLGGLRPGVGPGVEACRRTRGGVVELVGACRAWRGRGRRARRQVGERRARRARSTRSASPGGEAAAEEQRPARRRSRRVRRSTRGPPAAQVEARPASRSASVRPDPRPGCASRRTSRRVERPPSVLDLDDACRGVRVIRELAGRRRADPSARPGAAWVFDACERGYAAPGRRLARLLVRLEHGRTSAGSEGVRHQLPEQLLLVDLEPAGAGTRRRCWCSRAAGSPCPSGCRRGRRSAAGR